MAFTTFHCFLFLLLGFMLPAITTSIGINYGQIANNLPSPDKVVPLVKSIGAGKLKLYDADPKVLCAFAKTGVEFIIGLGNEYLPKMNDPNEAQAWVKTNVQAYLPDTKITTIAVGNEVLTFNDSSLSDHLLPAMVNVHAALVNLNLDNKITVTTSHSLAILESSYPPSSGTFRKDLAPRISQVLEFQNKICSPFLINAYPYFAYKANANQISIDFVLFQPNSGIMDPVSNLRYDNMLFAQIDAVYYALGSLGSKSLPVHISETGWPSKGDGDEVGANLDNAQTYNKNLMKLISKKKGTPLKPNSDLNIYVFALFNENLKPGPTSERNYGLFKPDGTPSYSLGIGNSGGSGGGGNSNGNSNNNNGNSSSGGGGGGGGGISGGVWPPPGDFSNGYMPVSSHKEKLRLHSAILSLLFLVCSVSLAL